MALDKPKESSDLSKFNINRLTTDAGLVEFAKLAQNASQNDLKKWWRTRITTQPSGASFGDTSYSDYLHRRLGIKWINEINNTTINALKQIAESGKITTIPYTTQTKGKEAQQVRIVEKPLNQIEARTYLLQFTDGKGEISKAGRVAWAKLDFDTRTKLQRSVNAYADGKIGRDTIDALKARTDGKEYQTTLRLDNLKKQIAGTEKTMQDLRSAGIQVGEASTTVPSSETTTSTVADTKATISETFVDTPEKQATRKLMEEAEAARITKLQVGNNTQTKTPIQETSSGDEYDDLRNSPANMTPEQASKVEAATTWTPPRAITPETAIQAKPAAKREVSTSTFWSLNEKYNTELQEVAKQFDPDKYTYVSFMMDTKEAGKITKVYQIDTNALKAEWIDDITKQNSFMLMHMVSLGGKAIPKYFRDIDTLSSNTIPGNLNGLNRLDYVNSLLKSQGKEIKPNILSDVNGLGVGLKKTLLPFGLDKLVGLGKTGNESVDADERKSEMNKIQSKIDQKNAKIFEANNKDNLGEHYVQILANAKSMDELVKRSETDPILQDILSTFNITKNPQDKLGLLSEDPLEKIKLNIAKQGKDHFKKTIGDFIDERSSEWFIVRNTNFLFDDVALQSITSKDGSGILKGNMDGGREIYLSAQRLDLNAAKLSYTKDGKSMELSNEAAKSFTGQTIDLGMQQSNASAQVQAMMKETKIRIDNNGVAYLITSPKYISTLSQIMSRTWDALTSKTAIEVYKIVGTVLLTLKLAGDHIGTPHIGTPNFPSINVSTPDLHTPDISSLNTALGGYVLTGLILNRKIALLEGDQRKTSEKPNANGLLQNMATKDGPETLAKVKEAIVESNTAKVK